jgi:hypothetical protein
VEPAPTVLPAGLDLGRLGLGECSLDASGGLAVGGELDRNCVLGFLEPFRGKLDEARAQLLGLLSRNADRGADQRNALFSFSKNPSSGR